MEFRGLDCVVVFTSHAFTRDYTNALCVIWARVAEDAVSMGCPSPSPQPSPTTGEGVHHRDHGEHRGKISVIRVVQAFVYDRGGYSPSPTNGRGGLC